MSLTPAESQLAKRLLIDVLDSFEKLEIAMHVHRSGFAATDVSEIAKATAVPADEVKNLMARAALDRVRSEAARVFSDAFLLRPKKKGDPDA